MTSVDSGVAKLLLALHAASIHDGGRYCISYVPGILGCYVVEAHIPARCRRHNVVRRWTSSYGWGDVIERSVDWMRTLEERPMCDCEIGGEG